MKSYRKKEDTVTKMMLSFAVGLFVQSFGDTQIACARPDYDPSCRWVVAVLSVIATAITFVLFYCVDFCTYYIVSMVGVYWVLNQTLPGVDSTWNQRLAYIVYTAVVILGFVLLCALRKRIRSIILDWIISAIACVILVYYIDYVKGASLGVFTGPSADVIGPSEYPDQRLYHIIEMTVLYAINRGAAVGAAVALQCYSSKPDDCAYRCRNTCCCCCCETDQPTQQTLQRRRRLQRRQTDRPIGEQIYDHDYGPSETRGEGNNDWRTVPIDDGSLGQENDDDDDNEDEDHNGEEGSEEDEQEEGRVNRRNGEESYTGPL